MSEIEEKIQEVHGLLNRVRNTDFAHEELGTANGFHEAAEVVQDICSYCESLLKGLAIHWSSLNDVIIEEKLTQITQVLTQVEAVGTKIKQLADAGVHNNSFPSQRTAQIKAVTTQHATIKKTFHPLELDLKLSELHAKLSEPEFFTTAKSNAENYLEGAKDSAGKIEKILGALQQKTIQKGVDESAGQFDDLLKHHKDYGDNGVRS